MQAVDRSFDDLLKGFAGVPVKLTDQRTSWQGSTLSFSLKARMGLLTTPIKGTVEVTDRDITIDADLGLLEKLIPTAAVQKSVGATIKGLLI